MIKPPRLQAGDRIRIVAPASPVRPEMFNAGVEALRALGFEIVYDRVFDRLRYLAGSDEHRRSELLEALKDDRCKAIFFARGGYGSSRILTEFEGHQQRFRPRILLGCSDTTSLHLFFQRFHDWVVFHGPMPSGDFARNQAHIGSFQSALMHPDVYKLSPDGLEVLRQGEAEGVLMGGCLTLLEGALGTPWEPDWTDAILFLEDVSVKPYQIDRMLTHLKIAGKLKSVRAFIFGEMKDCVQVENQGYTLQEVLIDVLGPLEKPIYFGFPSGHVSGLNWTLPLGVQARISSAGLEILEGAVE